MEQKVDAKDGLDAMINYHHLTSPPSLPPIKKLYKLMKNIDLVHLNMIFVTNKTAGINQTTLSRLSKIKEKQNWLTQFMVTATRLKFVNSYLVSIKFNQSCDYFIDSNHK